MACIKGKKLSAYVDGELGEEARAVIREHLASCPACREKVARLSFVAKALDSLEGLEPGPYFARRIRLSVIRPARGGWSRRFVVGAAAAGALSLAFGWFVGRALYGGVSEQPPLVDAGTDEYVETSPAQDFPDGSLGDVWAAVSEEGASNGT